MSNEEPEPKRMEVKINTDNIKAEMKTLVELEQENERLKKENIELLSKSKETGKGTLPASLNNEDFNSHAEVPTIKREFDSQEAMIDFLRSSKKAEDKALLNQLWNKTLSGIHNQPEKTLNFTYTAKIETDAQGNVVDSPITRALAKQNKAVRRA